MPSLEGLDLSRLDFAPAVPAAWIYGGLSLLTFLAYAWDKSAAKAGRSRISERTLHAWTLAGGFVGAIAGQVLLRHKTRKPSFVSGAWGALAAHAAVWIWILCG
jgi:uncharacterized membrane protein YsdA (DUF1294 family)